MMTQQNERVIHLPALSHEKLRRISSHSIPFRRGGIRAEHQIINGRHIFHNYGHGTAGISMAFGSSTVVVKSLTIYFSQLPVVECAVIGAGVAGLMTAIQLAKRGRIVTVYAQNMNKTNRSEGQCLSSEAVPVGWMPMGYNWSQDLVRHQIFSKLSYDFLKKSLLLKRYRGLKMINVYDRANKVQELNEIAGEFVFEGFRPVTARYGDDTFQQVVEYQTVGIDPLLFLEQLRIQAILRGVKFVQKRFNSLADVLNLTELAIMNCSGAASEWLFGDTSFQRMNGYVFELEGDGSEFILRGDRREGFDLVCWGKKTYLVSEGQGKMEDSIVHERLKQAGLFVEKRTTRARL